MRVRALIVCALLLAVLWPLPAQAAIDPNLEDTTGTQYTPPGGGAPGSGSQDDTRWEYCGTATICSLHYCPPDTDLYFAVDPITGEWLNSGWACFGTPPSGPSPGMIEEAFKAYAWPRAALSTSPDSGRVIINRRNVLYTDLVAPQTTVVTLLGVAVTIEATPSKYIWHSDAGGDSWSTTSPGRPFTGSLAWDSYVWVRYAVPREIVTPSVDVVYSGRYRIGNGPWTTIPDTLTLAGNSIELLTQEAGGRLIDSH